MGQAERLYGDIPPDQPRLSRQQRRELAEQVRKSVRQDAEKLMPPFLAGLKASLNTGLEGLEYVVIKTNIKL